MGFAVIAATNAGRLLVGLLVVIGATSCATAGEEGAASAIPTPRIAADFTLPLDAYDLSAADRKIVDRARFMMLADCTRTFGVELKPPPPSPGRTERHGNADYLAWLGDLQVEKYGYAGPPARLVENFTRYSVTDEQAILIEGKRRKFNGKTVPAGGCMGRTEALLDQGAPELLGGKAAGVRVEQDLFVLADDAADGAYKDARIREAERVWSDCMKDAGFDYPDTLAARGDPRWAYNAATDQLPKPRTPTEIATASADAACRMATNYSGARQAAYRDSQQRIIAKNQARLDRIKVINQAQIKNARKFLAGELAVTW
ncbi:hypothetical protein ACFFV7_21845 [Nonomuraea spiralis]|uniref:Lipoprotein n=1 Tax=Nonomuraea spiralis TaxID=46182 RepID=A0ABV5IH36_9ACTN|nr:hypothetical protein [Nonomuraea spiralis]GGS97242.1 hypothetical protein GCM10010176_046330 [Nonomuraea spiralis]